MVTRYIKDSKLYGAGDTVVGQVRSANEDNCGYASTINGELFVVCDGMGGHVGGATASKIAVNSIISFIKEHKDTDKRVLLRDALLFANMQILGAANEDISLRGMGTTACVVLVDKEEYWIAHVGDSRIYLYSAKEKYLYRITKDHSLVQSLVDQGQLDDQDAEHHPQKNIILRALGTKEDVLPDVEELPVHPIVGDTFLICSDGLSGMINDNEIEQVLQKALPLEDLVQELISLANTTDKGKDNITVQLIKVLQSTNVKSTHPNYNPIWRLKGADKMAAQIQSCLKGREEKKKIRLIWICSVILLLAVALLFGVHYLNSKKCSILFNKQTETGTNVINPETTTDNNTKYSNNESRLEQNVQLKSADITLKAGEQINLDSLVNNPQLDSIKWIIPDSSFIIRKDFNIIKVDTGATAATLSFILVDVKTNIRSTLIVRIAPKPSIKDKKKAKSSLEVINLSEHKEEPQKPKNTVKVEDHNTIQTSGENEQPECPDSTTQVKELPQRDTTILETDLVK